MYSAYVFDAYGTLFDVHAAVRQYAEKVGPDNVELSETWRQKQLEYTWTRTLMGRHRDFWQLTQEALDFAFEKVPGANRETRKDLLDAYWALDCFSEVPKVLSALKTSGVKTAILSNGSQGMLDAAVESAGLADVLDGAISIDRIGRFKAVPEVYQMVLDDFKIEANQVSFHSSNRWDVAAADAFGFRTVWINRGNQPDEYRDMSPDKVLSDLSGLIGEDGQPI